MSTQPSPVPGRTPEPVAMSWPDAREAGYAAGTRAGEPATAGTGGAEVRSVSLADADGLTLAEPLVALTDLPAFPTSAVDGWAVRSAPAAGPAPADGPWRIVGRVLAGDCAEPLTSDGTCVEIATGAMVPAGTTAILRIEDSTVEDATIEDTGARDSGNEGGLVRGAPRAPHEWRDPGEEAAAGEVLLPAGTPVTPGVLGLAATCGYDRLAVRPAPRVAVLVFGDELRTAGPPGDGRVRDSLGPSLPAWLRRLGAQPLPGYAPLGPVADTLDAHVEAIRSALAAGADLICTTGGTMHGPVDHLHPALATVAPGEDGRARYIVNTVAVRPGYPMLLASLDGPPGTRFLAGLPGNPQSAIIALVTLVAPVLAGLTGRPVPALPKIVLGAGIPGRGDHTHLALVRRDPADGRAYPVSHAGSSMLRGLAGAAGFAVIPPGGQGRAGDEASLVPLPLLPWEEL